MQPREAAQPLGRIAEARHRLLTVGERFAHGPLEDGDEQVVLAAEIEVNGAGGDAGGARDVGDLGVEEAAAGEDVDRGAEDRLALGERRRGGIGALSGGERWRHATE